MVLYLSLIRGQYLYSRAKPIELLPFNYLFYSFVASFRRSPEKKTWYRQFLFMKKKEKKIVNEYYLFLNQELSNTAVNKEKSKTK